jgi:hypothetical protein
MPSTVTHVPGGGPIGSPGDPIVPGERLIVSSAGPPLGEPKSEITPSTSTRSAGISLFAGCFVTIDTRASAVEAARVTHLDPRKVTRRNDGESV